MAEAAFTIAGRRYRLPCRPADQARLEAAGAALDARAARIAAQVGGVPETRLLLLLALATEGELQAGAAAAPASTPASAPDLAALSAAVEAAEALAERLEALAAAHGDA